MATLSQLPSSSTLLTQESASRNPSGCSSEQDSRNSIASSSLHICALCQQTILDALFTFPSTAPAALAAIRSALPSPSPSSAFCQNCWLRIYSLSLCWTCGEIVTRSEERVGFGWCWWHWGCMSCVFCRVLLYLLLADRREHSQ